MTVSWRHYAIPKTRLRLSRLDASARPCISTCKPLLSKHTCIETQSVGSLHPRCVQRFLRDALRVIRAATDISGDVTKALFWYRNEPLPVFTYKTAEQLVSEGRADDVLRYVSSLEAGAAG